MSNDKQQHCNGCRDDFYNGHNTLGVKQCWSLKDAKVVTRFKQPYWEPWPFRGTREVQTLDCWSAPGQYVMVKRDPRPSEAEILREQKRESSASSSPLEK